MTMREQPRDPASHDEVEAWLARARPEQLRRLIDDIRASGTVDDIRPPRGRVS